MSLEDTCWAAFLYRDHKEAVRLLPLVEEPNSITRYYSLLHLSSRNGWLDVTKDLITKYHCDPHEKDGEGWTCLHLAAEGNHVDVMRYLIDECHCDPMAIDRWGWTPLHCAANYGKSAAVEYLLSTGKCDPLAKDEKGNTPITLAKERSHTDILSVLKKFGGIKSSHPIDSYVNVLLVGNPGAGKSTLSHVINDTATGPFILGSFRNVGGVVPCTAGIIPYKLQHRTLDNIILHDFAGHSEYYSSHSAVIENLLQGSGGVFLIVVNIVEKEAVKQLHQWLTVVRNEAQKALNQCHVIVIVSHVDEISNSVEKKRRKEELQEIIVTERYDSVFLDCRKLGGSGMDSFFNKLCSACESIRSTSGRNLSLYCHMMYGLLEERKENILTLSDVMSAGKDNDDYFTPDKREDVLDVLDSLHSIGLISILKSEDKVWVVVNKGILLTEVDGILFAPETFKEHVDIASNTGIVSVSSLTRLFPKYDPDMLIRFLKNMELCEEISPSFLRMTNLHQFGVEEEEEGGRKRRGERLLHFPCLLSTDRPDEMTSEVFQFGWCLQCTSKHHFFPPRYFHVFSLRLAYKMALPQEDDKLNRYCTFWRNGLHWFDDNGVRVLVENVDESQCVLVMMSCKKGYSDNIVSVRRDVIGEVMSIYKESCPSLEVKELVIDPKELAYPVNTPRERTTYGIYNVLLAIKKRKPFLVSDKGQTELKEILPDESLSDISNLSLLGGRDIKEVIEITEEFKTPLTPIKLDIKDLDIVIEELTILNHLPCHIWHDLGLQLGLYQPTLEDINEDNNGDSKKCFRQCMSAWLRGEDKVREKGGPSWSSLATALDKEGKHHIATNIRDKYCQ
uniref:Death domain-containing protein n=1 Tax=Amphimedon queenslandica TaxID=400682 RepID=A0A1X7UC44_AMPQE